MHATEITRMFHFDTAVHQYIHPTSDSDFRSLMADNAELQPQATRAYIQRLARDRWHDFGQPEHVHYING